MPWPCGPFDRDSRVTVAGFLFLDISDVAIVTPRNMLVRRQKGLVKTINLSVALSCKNVWSIHDLDLLDLVVLQEEGVDDMVGDAFDQHEMNILGDAVGRREFEVHVIFRAAQRRRRIIMIGDRQLCAHRDAQRLRQVRFFGVDAGEYLDGQSVHFQPQCIGHKKFLFGETDIRLFIADPGP